ncbi:hypothetical protein EYF80_036409 [Liparis tanakae]|uniref:Uncharacterized protein n=1 Tax=Liparis tanakae TaxID=230148 RepID=A0A4Z2GL46_9TELE|nr:hypothetical protein EYF80_036409 [Liparis tanakae]
MTLALCSPSAAPRSFRLLLRRCSVAFPREIHCRVTVGSSPSPSSPSPSSSSSSSSSLLSLAPPSSPPSFRSNLYTITSCLNHSMVSLLPGWKLQGSRHSSATMQVTSTSGTTAGESSPLGRLLAIECLW